jgi:hypothetical protein
MPRWFKVTAISVVLLIVAVVVVMNIAGDDHGPGRHTPGDHGDESAEPSQQPGDHVSPQDAHG